MRREVLLWAVLVTIVVALRTACAGCPDTGSVLTSPTGLVQSNPYLQGLGHYKDNVHCKWVVSVPNAYGIDLVMNHFNVPDWNDFLKYNYCTTYKKIESVDDCTLSGHENRMTGDTLPADFMQYIQGQKFVFEFESDEESSGRGFELSYSIRTCPDSGSETSLAIGSFSDGPGSYRPGASCSWIINLDKDATLSSRVSHVDFDFTELDVDLQNGVNIKECIPCSRKESDLYCWEDVEDYDCTEVSTAPTVKQKSVPRAFSSVAKVFKIEFKASRWLELDHGHEGFTLNYAVKCNAGYYVSSSGCNECSSSLCSSGSYHTACLPGSTEDAICIPCEASLPEHAVWTTACGWVCEPNYFRQGGKCVQCHACSAGNQTQIHNCEESSDRTCKACSVCVDNQFEASSCSPQKDAQCAFCTSCTASQYETSECSTKSDRQCADCTKCSTSQFEVAPCTKRNDRQCAPCTECLPGHYESVACSGAGNRQCNVCSRCFSGQFEFIPCARSQNRQCRDCSVCKILEYELAPCTDSSDRQCADCDSSKCPLGHRLLSCGRGAQGLCEAAQETAFTVNVVGETVVSFGQAKQAEFTEVVADLVGITESNIALTVSGSASDRRAGTGKTILFVSTSLFTSASTQTPQVDPSTLKEQLERRGIQLENVTGLVQCTMCSETEYEISVCVGTRDRVCGVCNATARCKQTEVLEGCGYGEHGECKVRVVDKDDEEEGEGKEDDQEEDKDRFVSVSKIIMIVASSVVGCSILGIFVVRARIKIPHFEPTSKPEDRIIQNRPIFSLRPHDSGLTSGVSHAYDASISQYYSVEEGSVEHKILPLGKVYDCSESIEEDSRIIKVERWLTSSHSCIDEHLCVAEVQDSCEEAQKACGEVQEGCIDGISLKKPTSVEPLESLCSEQLNYRNV